MKREKGNENWKDKNAINLDNIKLEILYFKEVCDKLYYDERRQFI